MQGFHSSCDTECYSFILIEVLKEIIILGSSNKFTVTDGSTTEVLTLVNKAVNSDIAEGEMEIDAILDDSTTVHVTRLYGRKIQYEGGTEDVAKVRWAAGVHPGADDSGANVDSF